MAVLLKNLYNEEYLSLLCVTIKKEYTPFKISAFLTAILDDVWEKRELKERMRHISTTLGLFLPKNYKDAIEILQVTFNSMNSSYALENMIFQDFVEVYGLDSFVISMQALECFTIESSSEFAIRQFILKDQEQTIKQMLLWSKSENEHIRRLASEGSRSRLPWAVALPTFKKDPTLILEILEILKDDSSAYVRKSVANNLNDISKDNPDIIKRLTKQWLHFSKNRDAILKHGCRTLLKASDKYIHELFGFSHPTNITLTNFHHTQSVKIGEELVFDFQLAHKKYLGKLRIEFSLAFLRKNGKHNAKVFKIAEGIYESDIKTISKSYSFKTISTRVYYKGLQKLSIIINGVIFKEVTFTLE